jgi:hypothetical protein
MLSANLSIEIEFQAVSLEPDSGELSVRFTALIKELPRCN